MNLGDGLSGLVLQRHPAGTVEGAALGIDVDGRVHGRDLGLRKQLVFFEVALVARLNAAAILGGKILVQNMGVVVIPKAAADGAQREERGCRGQAWRAADGQLSAGGE